MKERRSCVYNPENIMSNGFFSLFKECAALCRDDCKAAKCGDYITAY